MAYVIAEQCIETKDNSCADVCPVDCIHPTPEEPDHDSASQFAVDALLWIDVGELELDERSAAWLESDDASATAKRNVEMVRESARAPSSDRSHRMELRFLRSPPELIGGDADAAVAGLRVAGNKLELGDGGSLRPVATGEEEVIECGFVVLSIGYRGRPLPEVPSFDRRGLIRNESGRVVSEHGDRQLGEYAGGWVKRGASGVIGTNNKDASDTVAHALADVEHGAVNAPARADGDTVAAWLACRVPEMVALAENIRLAG